MPIHPYFPKNFARLTAGLKHPAAIVSIKFSVFKNSKNVVCFRGASPRFRFFRLIRFAGLPRKSRGATSNSRSHSQPCSTHSRWTHPRACHRTRARQQPEPANLSV